MKNFKAGFPSLFAQILSGIETGWFLFRPASSSWNRFGRNYVWNHWAVLRNTRQAISVFTKAAKMSELSTRANWTDWNLHKSINHFSDVFFWRNTVQSLAEPVKALNGAWKAFNSKCSGQFQEVQLEQRLNTSVSEWMRLEALAQALNWKQSPLGNVQSRLLPVDRKWL